MRFTLATTENQVFLERTAKLTFQEKFFHIQILQPSDVQDFIANYEAESVFTDDEKK